jgi:hypothetical protein
MDVTETYLMMCDGAEEIQELNPMRGYRGRLACPGVDEQGNFGWCFLTKDSTERRKRYRVIWLPRQEQLQDLLPHHGRFVTLENAFNHWLQDTTEKDWTQYQGNAQTCPFFSMEQLWLAFVMKEKYGKTWDGEKWHCPDDPQERQLSIEVLEEARKIAGDRNMWYLGKPDKE